MLCKKRHMLCKIRQPINCDVFFCCVTIPLHLGATIPKVTSQQPWPANQIGRIKAVSQIGRVKAATRDWSRVLTPTIDNAPDILNKMNKLFCLKDFLYFFQVLGFRRPNRLITFFLSLVSKTQPDHWINYSRNAYKCCAVIRWSADSRPNRTALPQ